MEAHGAMVFLNLLGGLLIVWLNETRAHYHAAQPAALILVAVLCVATCLHFLPSGAAKRLDVGVKAGPGSAITVLNLFARAGTPGSWSAAPEIRSSQSD